jgi:hypothetical protein
MAVKKDKDDVTEAEGVAEVTIDARTPGTIIKEYVQNGLRYKRVVTEDGGTVDMRV